ncbi:hypothetical protein CFC21_037102, partial [Triticum aestivum]
CRRPAAPARATRAPSSRRRWCCGPCRWGSRSAPGDAASWPPWPPASPSSRPPTRPSAPRSPATRSSSTPPSRCSTPPSLIFVLLCQWRTKGLENMFQHEELVGSSWIGAYSALCFSCGYFAYDQLDMLRYRLYSGWIPGILMHHLILLICFTLALYRNVTINYLILTLLCEMHSIFLHVRKLRRMAGFRDFNRKLVKLEWVLNWTTFVTARVICHILITYRLITDAHKFDKGIELPLALSGMAGMNVLNVSLGLDLFKAFARERNQQTHQD